MSDSHARYAPPGSMAEFGFSERAFPPEGGAPLYDIGNAKDRPVLVMHELPGLNEACARFARRLSERNFHVHVPLLFGRSLDPTPEFVRTVRNYRALCVSEEFANLEAGKTAPIAARLRVLAAHISKAHGGAKVGVIGMCLTGSFVIPLIIEPGVAAAVASQPAIPLHLAHVLTGLGHGPWKEQINVDDEVLKEAVDVAKRFCKPILIQRFKSDRICPGERNRRLAAAFGSLATTVEYEGGSLVRRLFNPPHAVLTSEFKANGGGHLGQQTRDAFDTVVAFLDQHLD
ncbi:dienelactone hydrolase family protein [Rubrivivax rivuli]|uniref:Dienelactone hydrolase domain-containing protein n=1 Tax=Rubrivivax rivuli TaxID=1862385 RepID=A0A437RGW4_9BURK|nr:dienelactone hydrolase family protein [Rubrivivax rivuli]RVU46017.1 hypothetical protein EOE66_09080 [Rubrivivax rivuli]